MAISFSWASVLNSIRTAIYGKDVRENIAQMGEYCKQYAEEAGTRADSAKSAAEKSAQAAAKTASDTAASTLAALGLTVADGKICAVYRRDST